MTANQNGISLALANGRILSFHTVAAFQEFLGPDNYEQLVSSIIGKVTAQEPVAKTEHRDFVEISVTHAYIDGNGRKRYEPGFLLVDNDPEIIARANQIQEVSSTLNPNTKKFGTATVTILNGKRQVIPDTVSIFLFDGKMKGRRRRDIQANPLDFRMSAYR